MDHNRVGFIVALFLRHFFASIVSIAAAVLAVVTAYFVLLLSAILGNFGLGSPVALPLWAAAVGIASLFYTVCLLFPAVLFAELVTQKLRSRQALAQALSSTVALAVLVILLTFIARQIIQDPDSLLFQLAEHSVPIFLALCIPLGLYWWVTKVAQAAMACIIGLCKKAFRKEKAN